MCSFEKIVFVTRWFDEDATSVSANEKLWKDANNAQHKHKQVYSGLVQPSTYIHSPSFPWEFHYIHPEYSRFVFRVHKPQPSWFSGLTNQNLQAYHQAPNPFQVGLKPLQVSP